MVHQIQSLRQTPIRPKNRWTTYYGLTAARNLSNQLSQQIIKNTHPVIKLYGTTSDAASDYQFPSDIINEEDKIQYCMDIVAGTRELEVAGFTGDIYNTWKTTYYKMVDTVSSYTPRYSSRTLLYVLILCLIVYMFFVINKKQIKKDSKTVIVINKFEILLIVIVIEWKIHLLTNLC